MANATVGETTLQSTTCF